MPALSSIVDIVGGGTPSKQNPAYWGGDIPWVSVKDFKSSRIDGSSEYITSAGVKNSATTIIPGGNLIVPTRMALGKVAVNTVDVAINQDLKALLIKDDKVVDRDYLMRVLESKASEIEKKGKGATVKGITLDVLRDLDIPLPPLETQKKIAAILEKADQLRKDCQQMEQELNNLAQSVFMDMFGGMELNCRLEEHIDFLTSGSRGWAKYYSDSGSRFIRSLDVQMNYIGNADVAYVSAPDGREAERTRVAPGDVLLTITGSRIGRVAWVPVDFDEAYISQHVALLRLKETLIPQFLSYFLSLPALGQRQIAKSQYGQTKPGLKLDHIKEFVLPRLTVNQQQCFVDFMSKQEELLKCAKLQLLEADIGFDSIIRKAFSGKLNLKNKAA